MAKYEHLKITRQLCPWLRRTPPVTGWPSSRMLSTGPSGRPTGRSQGPLAGVVSDSRQSQNGWTVLPPSFGLLQEKPVFPHTPGGNTRMGHKHDSRGADQPPVVKTWLDKMTDGWPDVMLSTLGFTKAAGWLRPWCRYDFQPPTPMVKRGNGRPGKPWKLNHVEARRTSEARDGEP